MEILTAERECTFKLPGVKKEDSGNYTCVYSEDKQPVNTVSGVEKNAIFIQVTDFMMAQIFVKTPHVFEGDNVDVKCTHFNVKTPKILHVYLCKDGIGVSVAAAQTEEASFKLRQVSKEDSGNYSCVYSLKKHVTSSVTSTSFKNSVIIQVTVLTDHERASIEMDVHHWWVNVIRLLCSVGVVIAAVAVLIIHNFCSKRRHTIKKK
ncbi:uncharacterized protein LOC134069325 [Sardina pilchardus]|uniref:uncharacterized protein LOC134069325 n=1 Tax=Sardina pilchardus TaxID=27697 RepID=UPI002E149CE1